ncbi:MAG: patatin-like phospholipase family protein, partial [Acidobacteriota bacterium]
MEGLLSEPTRDTSFREVFNDELGFVAQRRAVNNRRIESTGAASVAGADDRGAAPALLPEAGTRRGEPSPERGLVGLAFSGGGIRSATFNLGVLQVFVRHGLIKWFDYLSTVSGGGYIGSTLSATMAQEPPDSWPPAADFLQHGGRQESELLQHLRNASRYLAPGGLLDVIRIPALLLRGIIVNLLVVAPVIGLLAILLGVAWPYGVFGHPEIGYRFGSEPTPLRFFYPTLTLVALFVVASLAFPLVASLIPGAARRTRSRFELSFSAIVLATAVIGALNVLPLLYDGLFDETQGGPPALWRYTVGGIAALVPFASSLSNAATRSKSFGGVVDKLKVFAVMLLGPLILLSMYLGMTRFLLIPVARPGVSLSLPGFLVSMLEAWPLGPALETTGGIAARYLASHQTSLPPQVIHEVLVRTLLLSVLLVVIFLYTRFFLNINSTGLHRFYRDRLAEAYLPARANGPDLDGLKLSQLEPATHGAPYHLINTALNIPSTRERCLRRRSCDFFVLSPRWSGSSRTGYCETQRLEQHDRNLDLGTAFAISGAAASPQMGVNSSRMLGMVMTMLNIRLDYWMRNPRRVNAAAASGTDHGLRQALGRTNPGPFYLLRELLGWIGSNRAFVNLSDGGHIENLGVYELLRRRCKYIVACDAEQDADMTLSSLGRLTGYARMDLGVFIRWPHTQLLMKDGETGYSRSRWMIGDVYYDDSGEPTGHILYIKSSVDGSELADIR